MDYTLKKGKLIPTIGSKKLELAVLLGISFLAGFITAMVVLHFQTIDAAATLAGR